MIYLRNSFLFFAFVLTAALNQAAEPASPAPANLSRTVERYEVEITPQIEQKSMRGSTTLYFSDAVKPSDELEFPVFDLNIDRVESAGQKLAFTVQNHRLKIKTLKPVKKIKIIYHGSGGPGLVFGEGYVYTGYETCSWMICDTFPAPRSKFKINIKGVKGLTVTMSDQNSAYSNYLFGFAAGRFNKYEEQHGKTKLLFLSAKDNAESLQKKFKDTKGMLDFFEEKAGLSYPLVQYTQVLVANDEAQEKYGFSVIGNSALDPILENPQEDWVIAHELSHQWWGNLLTCKDWSHFWLNEGITVFMVAAYKEKKWGQKAYENELALLQKRYQKAIDAKFNVPLTFAGDYPSMQIKRAITYSKGALFMAELRKKMGEQDFWQGFKNYTVKYAGQPVTTEQFLAEMQAAHKTDLTAVFDEWVRGPFRKGL